MSLIILTKSPHTHILSLENYKRIIKHILNKKRGPSSVTASLMRGLKEINYDFKLNPNLKEIKDSDTLFVNESLEALKWSLDFKTNNKIVAGPNLVVMPSDNNSVICNDKINIILEPSEWVKKLISSLKPEMDSKIKTWPAGVSIPKLNEVEKKYYLIYLKNIQDQKLIGDIKNKLNENKLPYKIIKYGNFKQEKYFEELEKSLGLIYLAKTESQGLALQEAWVRNVATMVLENNIFQHDSITFKDDGMAAPYLNEQTGLFFNPENFQERLQEFIINLEKYTPREYVIGNLSDKVCAEKFLDIIK